MPRLALAIAAILFAAAALAPLLAGDRPLVWRVDGRVEFPAFTALQAADVAWLVAFAGALAWIVFPRRWRRPVPFAIAVALGFGAAAMVPHRLDARDYRARAARLGPGEFALFPPIAHAPSDNDLAARLEPPSGAHWLGTDGNGRDVLARIVHGTRVSLLIGVAAVIAYTSIGIALGAVAGTMGSVADAVVSRLAETLLSFPMLFAVLVAAAFLPPSVWNIVIVLGIFGWPHVARLVRAECLRLREDEFVLAARALGASRLRVIARHLVPASLGPVLVSATFGVAAAILTESALSFLGLGIREPDPSWGNILALGREDVDRWWLSVFPGAIVFVTVLAMNAIGERLRERLDPRGATRIG
ncbi:MAG: ABC transporter permease [Planctomycetes bacterium]|nr:ABC transporter permease [Planctomycetota bacterium]MBI3848370.1 ABC transporter permease [Planctomycetota bacterium]